MDFVTFTAVKIGFLYVAVKILAVVKWLIVLGVTIGERLLFPLPAEYNELILNRIIRIFANAEAEPADPSHDPQIPRLDMLEMRNVYNEIHFLSPTPACLKKQKYCKEFMAENGDFFSQRQTSGGFTCYALKNSMKRKLLKDLLNAPWYGDLTSWGMVAAEALFEIAQAQLLPYTANITTVPFAAIRAISVLLFVRSFERKRCKVVKFALYLLVTALLGHFAAKPVCKKLQTFIFYKLICPSA